MMLSVEGVRILHWRTFQPGVFGGFANRNDTDTFDVTTFKILYGNGWCAI